ncbi:beta-1,4-mannosyltransferase [Nematocida ausubeli]|nr:beta-1,4-mannosyltransferase [Nematocida ausubeli]KAI5163680.1 beta-1,4-mannosyltransferase [Nematocida ausubeli]
MLVINLAPIDQSGRSLAIAQYLKKNSHSVTLVSYKGARDYSGRVEDKLNISYIRNIPTRNKPILVRQILILIKFVYISIMSMVHLYKYRLNLHTHGLKECLTNCKFYNKGGTVIFVVPPTLTVIFPLIFSKILGIRVIIDWHRISVGFMEIFDRQIARCAENITVTYDMQRYFISHRIKKPFLLTDIRLRKALTKKEETKDRKVCKKKFFAYLSEKYTEYKEKLDSIKIGQQIGICSTSCSQEENIEGFLEELNTLNIPQGGVLFITTKEKIECKNKTLQVIQVFLDYNDYLDLLAVADFGISTHVCRLDFPLKIVDYMDSGLKVLAHSSTPSIGNKKDHSRIIRYTNNMNMRRCLARLFSQNKGTMRIETNKIEEESKG